MAENNDWVKTTNRFVAFFDIMGFKELVLKNPHDEILEKLETLKKLSNDLVSNEYNLFEEEGYESLTRSVSFSDSFLFFSKSNSKKDALKIILDSTVFILIALDSNIAIKGALSYGEVTVDFDNSLFFGQPIINAYELHDELQMYSCIADHNFEKELQQYENEDTVKEYTTKTKVNLKSGKVEQFTKIKSNL